MDERDAIDILIHLIFYAQIAVKLPCDSRDSTICICKQVVPTRQIALTAVKGVGALSALDLLCRGGPEQLTSSNIESAGRRQVHTPFLKWVKLEDFEYCHEYG